MVLVKCPFCNGEAEIIGDSHIECPDCGCVLPEISGSIEETVRLWNERREILSCPLCGNYAYKNVHAKEDDGIKFSIHCINCDLHTKTFDTEEEAIHAWNIRSLP